MLISHNTAEEITVTTRLTKVSCTSKTPAVQVVCPACRATRRCRSIGTATVNRTRREVLECGEPTCGLQWLPARTHLTITPTAA